MFEQIKFLGEIKMNYWNSTGRFQSEYDEMVNVGFAFTNKEKKAMHKLCIAFVIINR